MENKERFLQLCKSIHREGVKLLISYLDHSDFFVAPASTAYHGSYPGGLLEHSLNVYDEYKRLLTAYPEICVPEESVVIMTLFHDLCKVNTYQPEKRNRKNAATGAWETYDAYSKKEKLHYGGHGSKSVFILQQYIKLTVEEAVAINCHMSCWDGNTDVGSAFQQFPLAWLLHVADESATYIKEVKADESKSET